MDPAPYLYDEEGEPVWEGKKGNVMLFGKHRYRGKDVLAYYTGEWGCAGVAGVAWRAWGSYRLLAVAED